MINFATVVLADGTVGKLDLDSLGGRPAEDWIGETVRVELHDENGMPVSVEGELVDVI